MRDRTITQFVGVLLRPSGDAGRAAMRLLDEHLEDAGHFGPWRAFEFASDTPFAGESHPGPFNYRVYALFGKALGAVITLEPILSVLRGEVLSAVRDTLRTVTVDTDGIVDDISSSVPYVYVDRTGSERSIRFLLSYMHARTPGLGIDIKSLSLYGENISNGRIFREHRGLFNVSTCGIRRASTKEIVKIGADGALTVQVNARWVEQRLLDLTNVMAYLVDRGRILDASSLQQSEME